MKRVIIITVLSFGAIISKAQIPLPDPDTTAQHFLVVASIGNLQEISAGKLAVQKAERADVRSFGQMMVKEHGDAEQKLLAFAESKHILLPASATGHIKPDLNLENAGKNFDKLYVHAMVSGHGNKVQMFEYYATTGKDPDVRAFAQSLLPIIKEHMKVISAIDKQIGSDK